MPRRRPPKLDKETKIGLSDQDADLWSRVTETMKPLDKSDRRGAALPKRVRPTLKGPGYGLPPILPARTPEPLDRHQHRQLVSGRRPIDMTLDLHGLSQDRAHAVLVQRVREAYHKGQRTLLVVTGKGGRRFGQTGDDRLVSQRLRSDFGLEGGVLKRMLPLWLAAPELASYIAGYGEADRSHGGAGALYVSLKRHKK